MIRLARLALFLAALLPTLAFAQGQGGPGGSVTPGSRLRLSDYVLETPLQVFADPLGNDTNACTSTGTGACLTCNAALARIPKRLMSPAKITLAAGTYAGCNVEGFQLEGAAQVNADTATYPAWLTIEGTLSAFAPATGVASGTFDSGTAESTTAFATATLATGAWTVNDLAGRILHITAGTGAGQFLMIASNTATVITIAGTVTTLNATSVFALETPGTIFSTATAPGISAIEVGTMGRSYQPTGTLSLLVRYIRVTGSVRGVSTQANLRLFVDNSRFEGTSFSLSQGNNGGTEWFARRNAFVGTTIAAIATGTFSVWNVSGNYSSTGAVAFMSLNSVGAVGVISDRNYMAAGSSFVTGSNSISATLTRDRVASGTGPCLDVGNETTSFRAGNGRISTLNADLSGCTDALRLSGGVIAFLNATTGTGNSGYGVRSEYGALVEINSTTTVTGTTGDTILDGTAYTYAVIRALVPKAVSNLSFGGSTIYER
jgi:hypothetical protein